MQFSFLYRWLLICCITILFFNTGNSKEQEKYLHFTEIDGLPRNITTCLEKDKYGYLWVGTGSGLARYDGKNFYIYKELSGAGIIYILNDSKNNLWVAADKGLFLYNRITNSFERKIYGFVSKVLEDNGAIYFLLSVSIGKIDSCGISTIWQENNLSDFCFSREGIWISKVNNGVELLSRESGLKKIETYFLPNTFVTHIEKVDDKLFIGCHNGQLYVVLNNRELRQIKLDNHYIFKRILRIGQEYWLATDGNGILILDRNLLYSRTLNRNKTTSESINSNSIYDIFPEKNGEIWLASYGAGLTCILPDNLLFRNILPEKGNENSLIANEGISVYVKEPYFFFGTNYGLSVWNEKTNKFKNLSPEKLKDEIKGIKVTALNVDNNNNLWLGSYDGLLGKFTSELKFLKTYHPSSRDKNEMQQIIFLEKIDNSNLLVGTQFQNRFLLNYNIEKDSSAVFELFSKGSNRVFYLFNSLRKNQKGEWIALVTNLGLFYVNLKNNVLENRLADMNRQIDFTITDFYNDKRGNYWFTSATDGLIRISENGKNLKKWSLKEGFPTNTLIRIESVDDRYLWISSISGLCRFDTETQTVLNFSNRDGLPANEFLERVSAKTKDGRIIFGSIAGFTIVNPGKVYPDSSKSEVIISDIIFQNQSIRSPKRKQVLKEPLEEAKEIYLPYNKNSFSIFFFVKDKSFAKYPNYAYRLVGLEKDWIFLGEANHTNYTNLSPGTYIFEIKIADKSQNDFAPKRLIIHIESPWYLSWYAYLAYAILCFTIIYLSAYAYLKRIQLKKEKEISEFKIQKEHELTEKKLAFFTNISHDLKTPLTLIDAPVNDLLRSQNLEQEQVNKLIIIRRNSKRLYKLIADLLDFRKLTQKQYVLEVKETNIYEIVDDIYLAFQEECKNKSIRFEKIVKKEISGYVDSKKIEKIIWNLLSNALKFTPEGGSITLSADEIELDTKRNLLLKVKDTGIGIAEKDQPYIFDRFYQVGDSGSNFREGSGIGLSIVKELTEMHHGNISVESELGKGTTINVVIPLGKENYITDELALFETFNAKTFENNEEELTEETESSKPKHYNLPSLLIVEDNRELREYLKGHFEKKYRIYQAEDGKKGLNQVMENAPDIILTDVKMPNMNGYEFCRQIRMNFETSHIPVIMLTANNTTEQQIEGLSTGADAYISKPFDIDLLDTTLLSVLNNRKKLRIKFLGIEPLENHKRTLPPKDAEFVEELKKFIYENLANIDLNIDMVSNRFAVSNTQLYRKIKSLLNTTPNSLIKSIRLKKAYELLQTKDARVSEVAFQTGFNDPNYFTYCFKKEFGKNPSQIGIE